MRQMYGSQMQTRRKKVCRNWEQLLERQLQANFQEKTAANQALEKPKQECGADHANLSLTLSRSWSLSKPKWPATQDAPTVGGMIHQARAVLEKFTSRSPDPQHTRSMTTPTNMQAETHGADDDLDLDMEGPFTPSSAREKVVQGCGSTIAEHGAQNVPRRKWKAAGTQRVGTTDKIRAAHLEGGAAPPRYRMARAHAAKSSLGGPEKRARHSQSHRRQHRDLTLGGFDDSQVSMQISQPATPRHHDGDAATVDENLVLAAPPPAPPPALPSA